MHSLGPLLYSFQSCCVKERQSLAGNKMWLLTVRLESLKINKFSKDKEAIDSLFASPSLSPTSCSPQLCSPFLSLPLSVFSCFCRFRCDEGGEGVGGEITATLLHLLSPQLLASSRLLSSKLFSLLLLLLLFSLPTRHLLPTQKVQLYFH